MTRKSRTAPATIAGFLKLEATLKAKQAAHYAAADRYKEYKQRVRKLGNGYTEIIDGVTYALAMTPERYGIGSKMTIAECKKPAR